MNLILFERHEVAVPLPRTDPRARHLSEVLRRSPGEAFDCGIVDGPRGRGWIARTDTDSLHLEFTWQDPPAPLDPVWLLVGVPRPQTVRKILVETTALGVERIVFFPTEKGDGAYAQSSVWEPAQIRRRLMDGAEQAFCTRLPEVTLCVNLVAAIALLDDRFVRLALDNYEALQPLSRTEVTSQRAILAVGGERGWSTDERNQLRSSRFRLVHLGSRVLRTETACVAGIALLKARLGLL